VGIVSLFFIILDNVKRILFLSFKKTIVLWGILLSLENLIIITKVISVISTFISMKIVLDST